MITERHEELAALHAFGLLDDAERAAFETELAADRELRRLTEDLAAAAAPLALTARSAEPPADLKARILAAATPPAHANVTPFPIVRLLPWAAAAGFALLAGWFGLQTLSLGQEAAALRTERDLADTAYRLAQSQLGERTLLAEKMIADLGQQLRTQEDLTRLKVTALAALAGNTKEAQAIAVWDPAHQTGLLTVEKLPAIAASQDYQIWIVDPAYPNPVNGGVFSVGADGRIALPFKPDQPVAQATAFAISVERKGGVPKAEGPIVLLGK